jgi:HlyD family secretion protein
MRRIWEYISMKIVMSMFLVIAAAIFAAGCKEKKDNNDKKTEPKTVTVAQAMRIDIVRTITLTGTVKPIEDSLISAEIAGAIMEKSVRLGDFVKKNDTLAMIDEETYKKVYNQAEAILTVAQASLEQSKATQKQLQEDQATNERLYQQNVIARKVLDDINTKLAEVNAMVKVSEAKVKEAEIARDVSKINLNKANVKCPLEKAYVADVSFEVGNYVVPGKPLVRLVNIEQVWIEIGVGEQQISEVERMIATSKEQDKDKKAYASFTVRTLANKKFIGSIEEISPYADPATGSFTLRMRCENATHELKGGMFAEVLLPTGTQPDSIVVPQSAVIRESNVSYVFVANSVKAKKVEVITGISQNEQIQIIQGLTGDETIVVDGADMLADGDVINPLNPESKGEAKEKSLPANNK